MKIAFFTDVFLPSVNGVVTVVQTSAKGLSDRGDDVAIFFPEPAHGEQIKWRVPRVDLFPIPSVPSLVYPDFRIAAPTPKSLFDLRRFNPDIIHVQAPGIIGLEGLVGAKLLKVPLVGSFHTYFMEPEFLKLVKLSRFGSVTKALWSYTIKFYNRCSAVFVHSQYMSNDLVAHGLDKSKIMILPNALDFTAIKAVTKKTVTLFQKKYNLGKNVILFVGRLSKDKNLEVLIRAFTVVIKNNPNVQLLLVGDGPAREDLESLVNTLDINKRVIFTGSIPHEKLIASGAFQAATLFCTPSTTETQCMSVLEAMAAGKPIIGMAAMGMLDMVNKNGVLVRPFDIDALAHALTSFLEHPRKIETAGQESLKLATKHTVSEVMKLHEKAYKNL